MILAKLKAGTRAQHENLETIVDVMDSGTSRETYEQLIARFYRFYSAIEPLLENHSLEDHGIDLAERQKIHLLDADITNLGIADVASHLTAPEVPVIDSTAKAFGTLYVLEGATLGGQVITRHLKQHIGIDPDSGCAFFNSYGANVGPMWKQFGAAITEFADKADEDDEIVQAAKDTFDSFARYFSQNTEDKSHAQAV